jgi:hypothetical protein
MNVWHQGTEGERILCAVKTLPGSGRLEFARIV